MTKANAIKRLNKLTGNLKNTVHEDGNRIWVQFPKSTLSFHVQEDYIVCISTKSNGLENDSMTDMFYDIFHDNLTQAINFLDRDY